MNTTSGSGSNIGGGYNNRINATYGSISGGLANLVLGSYGTVSGGRDNIAYSYGEWVGGLYAQAYTPAGSNAWVGTDRLFVVGNGQTSGTRSNAFTIFKSGDAVINGNFTFTSDSTLKTNIQPIENAYEKLLKISGYTYYWKDNGIRSRDKQIGLLSQEVERFFPSLINEGLGYKSLNYIGLIPVLVEGFKELDRQNKEL